MIRKQTFAEIGIIDKGLLPLENNSVAIQFFMDIENKNPAKACNINCRVIKCCLTDVDAEDCDTMRVFSEGKLIVKPKHRETFIHVYPSLHQHDQVGYCNFALAYQCGDRNRIHKLDTSIAFNTKVVRTGLKGRKKKKRRKLTNALMHNYVGDTDITACDTLDLNSLDNCAPVDCNIKYLDGRPFYDPKLKWCLKAPVCKSDANKELPDTVYVPNLNICKDVDHPINVGDIFVLSSGQGVVTDNIVDEEQTTKPTKIQRNALTISQNLCFLGDLVRLNLFGRPEDKDCKFCISAMLSILFYILAMCGAIFGCVCIINIAACFHKKWWEGEFNNVCANFKSSFTKKPKVAKSYCKRRNCPNPLLREVTVKNIPIELRGTMVDVCHRMEHDVRQKRRYRRMDMGSQVSLSKEVYHSPTTSSNSSLDAGDDN